MKFLEIYENAVEIRRYLQGSDRCLKKAHSEAVQLIRIIQRSDLDFKFSRKHLYRKTNAYIVSRHLLNRAAGILDHMVTSVMQRTKLKGGYVGLVLPVSAALQLCLRFDPHPTYDTAECDNAYFLDWQCKIDKYVYMADSLHAMRLTAGDVSSELSDFISVMESSGN